MRFTTTSRCLSLTGMSVVGIAVLAASGAGAQSDVRQNPPTDSALAAITERGRDLAAYDAVAWHATDALEATPADTSFKPGIPAWYAIRHDSAGWAVAFGRISAALDTMFIAAVVSRPDTVTQYSVQVFRPPRPDTGYYARSARAAEIASRDFGSFPRPYNVTVIPASGGDWWVYVYPAATQTGVWLLGADQRDRVSADGRAILERRRLHRSILEYRSDSGSADEKLTARVHSAVLDNVPEDTDVFVVLERRPQVPEYIGTALFDYRIDVDGQIHYLGRRANQDKALPR